MWQQKSEKYGKYVYTSSQRATNIYIDGTLINPNYVKDLKKGGQVFDNEFTLGSTPSQYIEITISKNQVSNIPKIINIEHGILINQSLTVAEVNAMLIGDLNGIPVKSLSTKNSNFEMIPIGIYNVDDYTNNDDNTITIKASDNMVKFDSDDGYYDASELIAKKGYATLGEIAQDICNKKGVELGSTSFTNSKKHISVYDNSITAREYIGYISECAGCFACIGRDGKLYFRKIGQDVAEIPLKFLNKGYKWGEEFKITKVSYEDGTRSYKFGDETGNNLWISQENIFIIDEKQIENIYNEINGLTINSFEGQTIIDPAIDIGDLIIIGDKAIVYQGEMELKGRFIAQISSKIQISAREETTVKKESQTLINRKVQSRIDKAEGKITQLIAENTQTSEKLAQQEITLDSISQQVSDIEDLTKTTDGIETVVLENCLVGDLLELHIYGNNTIFDYLYPSDDSFPADDLFPYGDSRIEVSSYNGQSEESTYEDVYELGIKEVLRQNEEVYDEYILEDGKAQVIRRVNTDGTTKENETVEDLGEFSIPIKDIETIINIKNYSAKIKVKYVVKNGYTDNFASKVEMSATLKVTAEEINSEVKKKVDENEIISKINQSAEAVGIDANKIELSANDILNLLAGNTINLKSKNIILKSDKVNIDADGKITCADIKITGGKIVLGGDETNPELILKDEYSETSLFPLGILNEYNGNWACVQKGALGVGNEGTETGQMSNDYLKHKATYNSVSSSSANVFIDGAGYFYRATGSSKRWKKDITEIIEDRLNPEALYSLPIKQFKYKEDYLNKNDKRYNSNILGFIAEDVAEIYEPAVQYDTTGQIEMWNSDVMIPAMLKLIQTQKERIDKLIEKVENLEKEK